MSRHYSAALPIAYVVLRLLIILNWLYAAAILVLLLLMPHEQWITTALDLSPGPGTERIILGLQTAAILTLAAVPLNHGILTRLLAMCDTVRGGDPFVRQNAGRLQTMAWLLLAIQLLAVLIGAISKVISTPDTPLLPGSGFSVAGWVAVLVTFVLARVFAEGSLIRDELREMV